MIPISNKKATPEEANAMHSGPAGLNDRWTVFGVCIFLAAIIWAVFGQTLRYGFVDFDDHEYVVENPEVSRGLTLKGFVWAFTHVHSANWHPLTWISHMLDCQFYGLNAGGHHLTNILLHTTATILLFLVLRQMTGFLWRSAFVAAVFAIHPLRVESVAWVAERKDVLSGVFFMLTLCAYVRYARGPWSAARYGLVVLMFALGLMSKPMLVTLPLVLLLLDYWPLNRLQVDTATQPVYRLGGWRISRRAILEKLPLLGLVAASCVATLFAQSNAIASLDQISPPLLVGNALIAYVVYLGQMFWPSGLSLLYPFPVNGVPPWEEILAPVLLLLISAAVFLLRKTRPYLVVGWLWYLVMLMPVIGIVQVGSQAHADRYTYLPQIGLYVLLVWAAADLCVGWRWRRVVLGGGSAIILAALIFCAHAQTAYWRDSETLWTHTLACTSNNAVAHNNLGNTLVKKGRVDEAFSHFRMALQIKPDYADAHNNLGNALFKKGNVDEAIAHYQRALQINPDFADAHYNLGNALFQKGEVDEAIAQFQEALQIDPDNVEAHYNLGLALFQKGSVDEAIDHYKMALQIHPDYADAHYNLGIALFQKGRVDEAIAHYQRALQINPDSANAHNNLGTALVQKGDVNEAFPHFRKALQIKPDYADAHNNLGNALFKTGKVDEAIAHYQRALQINPDFADAHYNLGNALLQKGEVDEAIEQFQMALQINPDNMGAHYNLGNARLQKGNVDEAIVQFQKVLQINPDFARAHNNLGQALLQKGKVEEAIKQFQKALQIHPDFPGAQNNLAWVLATCPRASLRNGNQAVALAERANQLTGNENPSFLGTLAAAYAEAGQFGDAIRSTQEAMKLAQAAGRQDFVAQLNSELKLYSAGLPFRQESK
jgi:tetratricopeptide (TPR) repeat protein